MKTALYCQIVIITTNVKGNRLYMCMGVYAFNRLFIMPSLRSFVYSSIHSSIHLFVLWFVYCIIFLFIHLFIHSERVFVAWRSEPCRYPLCMDIKTSLFCCCFVVRDFCRSGCRQNLANFFLTPPPGLPLFFFFCPSPPTILCLTQVLDLLRPKVRNRKL